MEQNEMKCDRVWLPGAWQVDYGRNDSWLFSVWAALISVFTSIGAYILQYALKAPIKFLISWIGNSVVMLFMMLKSIGKTLMYGFMGHVITRNITIEQRSKEVLDALFRKMRPEIEQQLKTSLRAFEKVKELEKKQQEAKQEQ